MTSCAWFDREKNQIHWTLCRRKVYQMLCFHVWHRESEQFGRKIGENSFFTSLDTQTSKITFKLFKHKKHCSYYYIVWAFSYANAVSRRFIFCCFLHCRRIHLDPLSWYNRIICLTIIRSLSFVSIVCLIEKKGRILHRKKFCVSSGKCEQRWT